MNQLIAEDGVLAGRDFPILYSTQDESAFGDVEGRIRNLAARYIEEIGGIYEGHLNGGWEIVGVGETPDYVVELVNDGILSIGETEGGNSNVEAINLTDPVDDALISDLAAAVGVDEAELAGVSTTGELYQKLNEARK